MPIPGISRACQSTIRDELECPTADPQIAHMLSRVPSCVYVDKLCINSLLLRCNDLVLRFLGLYVQGFLPTMKLQLSQLP